MCVHCWKICFEFTTLMLCLWCNRTPLFLGSPLSLSNKSLDPISLNSVKVISITSHKHDCDQLNEISRITNSKVLILTRHKAAAILWFSLTLGTSLFLQHEKLTFVLVEIVMVCGLLIACDARPGAVWKCVMVQWVLFREVGNLNQFQSVCRHSSGSDFEQEVGGDCCESQRLWMWRFHLFLCSPPAWPLSPDAANQQPKESDLTF